MTSDQKEKRNRTSTCVATGAAAAVVIVIVIAVVSAAAAVAVVVVVGVVAVVGAEQWQTRADWQQSGELRNPVRFARRHDILPPLEEKDRKVEKVRRGVGLVESQSNLV
jgi:hypothetical protein